MDQSLIFSIQTLHTSGGRDLQGLEPDANGKYTGIPLAVIGMASRNNIYYTPDSFKAAMTNPESRFAKALQEGHLEGEWGHPFTADIKDPNARLMRTMTILRQNVSHAITGITTKMSSDGNYVIVYGDITPCGPYGSFLDKDFRNPNRNVGFSLRSLTNNPKPMANNVTAKSIVALATFDAVDTPGFELASKRYASTEGLLIDESSLGGVKLHDVDSDKGFLEAVGYESIQCQEILDILQRDAVTIEFNSRIKGHLADDGKSIITPGGNKSIFHLLQ